MSAGRSGPVLALCALPLLALGGCVATQRDVLDLEGQTDELKTQVTELKKSVSTMQANQADLALQMKQLREDLGVFTETIKESQGAMSQLSSKLDDMSAGVQSRVAAIGTTLTTQQAKGLEDQKAALARQEAALAAAGTPSELFQAADVRLRLKNHALAAKGFEEYLAKWPKGALADVAVFKLGQAYYGDKKWEAAGRQFAVYLEKHPRSELTPSARLFYALCLLNLKKGPAQAEARQYLESIPADFPRSPEAKAASEQLRKLAAPSAARPKAKAAP